MHSQALRPQADLRPAPALAQRLERQVFAPARQLGEELSLVAITEPPPPVSILHPPQGGTWIAARHDSDPVAAARGALHAPEEEIARLTQLHRAGVDPDVILVGHELRSRWRPGDPVPAAYLPGESSTVGRVLGVQAGTIEAGRRLLRAVAGIGVGMGTAAAVGLAKLALVDPFVLAGVRDPQTGLVGWVLLGAWDERSAD
jgi:hypothetical protein